MKKVAFLVLTLCLIIFSCSKRDYYDIDVQRSILFEQISNIVNLRNIEWNSEDLIMSNCNNPFEEAGIMMDRIIREILITTKVEKSDPVILQSEFPGIISNSLSELGLSTDTMDFCDDELVINKILIEVYMNEGFDTYNVKSKRIEEIISNSTYFNENQKKRLLVGSSMVRYSIYSIDQFFVETEVGKSGPWSDCFMQKLKELQNCRNCWIEKISCSLSWPTCLGIKALDCAIASIK